MTSTPAGAETTTITARDGTRLAVHAVGSGAPLLCVPGGPGRAAVYLEDLGGLSASRRLLLLDNRGSGGSDLPADRSSLALDRLPDDVADVGTGLGLGAIDVLGHSAGCPVTLLHAVRRPDLVRRLVLVTPSARAFGHTARDLDDIRAARADEPWYADAAEAVAALEHARPNVRGELERETRPFWYGQWDDRTRAHASGADQQVSLRAAAGYVPGPSYDAAASAAALREVSAPTLVVVGTRDALTGVEAGHWLAASLPDARVAVLDGAGHFPWVDERDAFREAIEQFLSD